MLTAALEASYVLHRSYEIAAKSGHTRPLCGALGSNRARTADSPGHRDDTRGNRYREFRFRADPKSASGRGCVKTRRA